MAFLLLLAEYYVVKLTSSVTITVAGVGKEIFVIFLGVMFWHESLSFSQMCGIMLSVVGILIYSYLRHKNAPRYSQDLPEHALFDFITMDEDDLSDEENEWAPEEYDRRSVFKIPRLSRGNTGGSNLAEMASPEDTPGEAPPLEVDYKNRIRTEKSFKIRRLEMFLHSENPKFQNINFESGLVKARYTW